MRNIFKRNNDSHHSSNNFNDNSAAAKKEQFMGGPTSLNNKITNQILSTPSGGAMKTPGSATQNSKHGKAHLINQQPNPSNSKHMNSTSQLMNSKQSNTNHHMSANTLNPHQSLQGESMHGKSHASGLNFNTQLTESHHHLHDSNGRKRTSFLLHAQGSGGQSNTQPVGNNLRASRDQKHHGSLLQSQLLQGKKTSQTETSVGTGFDRSSNMVGPDHEMQKYLAKNDPKNVQLTTTSPKKVQSTRKPSGKSNLSNRGQLPKKQIVTQHQGLFQSSQNQNDQNRPTSFGDGHLYTHQSSQMTNGGFHEVKPMSKQVPHPASDNSLPPSSVNTSAGNMGGGSSNLMLSKNQIDFSASRGGGGHMESATSISKMKLQQHTNQTPLYMNGNQGPQTTLGGKEQGAVAAVVQQVNTTGSTFTGESNQNYSSLGSAPNGSHVQKNNSQSQQFLPHINGQAGVQPANQLSSPYQSVEELQGHMGQQQIGQPPNSGPNFHHNNQAPAMNDYFSVKVVQQNKNSQSSQNLRSTSQPNHIGNTPQAHSHALYSAKQNAQSAANFNDGQNSNSVLNAVVPGSREHSAPVNNEYHKARASSEPPQPMLHTSESTNSFMENYRQRTVFTLVMKANMLPKQPKIVHPEGTRTEAQNASQQVKETVAKLLQKNQPQSTLPFFQTSKISSKAFGAVKAFAANTNVGIVRKANEDRISIILNVIQPTQKTPRIPNEKWPKLQIFGVYDGHGGSKCAEYLKDNLHNNIILQPDFPKNIPEAIRKGSYKTEEDFLNLVCPSPDQPHNKAGSCAIVILVVNDDIYVLNVGDSRAISSISEHPSNSMIQAKAKHEASTGNLHGIGQNQIMQLQMEATSQVKALSKDHKPSDPDEYRRIVEKGGYVYQTQTVMKNGMPTTQTTQVKQEVCPPPEDSDDDENPFVGPYRVFPGRLSVCRTFGDCEAKISHLQGIKGVVTCDPDIVHEQNGVDRLDYIIIGSDGIFDKLKNDEINKMVWDITTKQRQMAFHQNKVPSIHTISGIVADEVLHASARKRSLDNLSIVFIAFQRYWDYINAFKQEVKPPSSQIQIPQSLDENVQNTPMNGSNKIHPLSQMNMNRTPQRMLTRKISANNPSNGQSSHTQTQQDIKNGPDNMPKNLLGQFSSDQQSKTHNTLTGSYHYKYDPIPTQPAQMQLQAYSNQVAPHTTNNASGSRPLSLHSSIHANQINGLGGDQGLVGGPSIRSTMSEKGNQYSSIYASKLKGDTRTVTLNTVVGERPNSRGGASRKSVRSRKGNTIVQNGSHSQDTRPTLPPMQLQKQQQNTTSSAYNHQLAETRGATNSQSAANLTGVTQHGNPQSQTLPTQHSQSSTILTQSHAQTYQPSDQKLTNSIQQKRQGLFKVGTQSTHQMSSQGHNVLQNMIKGSSYKNNTSFQTKHHIERSNGQILLDGANQVQNVGQNSLANSSNKPASQSIRKKMKQYKSSQTRKMPDTSQGTTSTTVAKFSSQGGANSTSAAATGSNIGSGGNTYQARY